MDQKALSKLLKVVEREYRSGVSVIVTTTNEYTCNTFGNLIPVYPVEVLVNPTIQPEEKRPRFKDFSVEAVVIGLKIHDLLMASHPETLNLPSKVKVVSWGRESYSFLGRESVKEKVWR
jgi:hypothetical protein